MITPLASATGRKQLRHPACACRNSSDTRGSYDAVMDELNTGNRSGGGLAVIAAAMVLLAVTMGSRTVVGLFLSPLNSATGLGVATISFAIAVSQLTWGVAQPFAGMLAERMGAARVILGGTLLARSEERRVGK